MAQAQSDLEMAIGNTSVALFLSNAPSRPKPSFVENDPGIGIWRHMAGRLDWLRAELAKL